MASRFWLGARGRFGSMLWAEREFAQAGAPASAKLFDLALAAATQAIGRDSRLPAAPPPAAAHSAVGALAAQFTAAVSNATPLIAAQLGPIAGETYNVVFSGASSLVTNDAREVLAGGLGDWQDLTRGNDDQLVIGGDVGDAMGLGLAQGFEEIVLLNGSSYGLVARDSELAAGKTLTLTATMLSGAHGVRFDGSAETDGNFRLNGGNGADSFTGGRGADTLYGIGGADRLEGGAGADRFFYTRVSESTGAAYDTIVDFSFGEDKIDLLFPVTGLGAAVRGGTLSRGSFDADLAAAVGASKLGVGQALFFTPDGGDLAGKAFLVVDANGKAGYQAGEDLVIHFETAPPADLTGVGFFI